MGELRYNRLEIGDIPKLSIELANKGWLFSGAAVWLCNLNFMVLPLFEVAHFVLSGPFWGSKWTARFINEWLDISRAS